MGFAEYCSKELTIIEDDGEVAISPDASIGKDCTIIGPVSVMAEVRIGDNCTIGPGVDLHQDAHIGARNVVRRSVIGRGATILADTQEIGDVMLGDGRAIGTNERGAFYEATTEEVQRAREKWDLR